MERTGRTEKLDPPNENVPRSEVESHADDDTGAAIATAPRTSPTGTASDDVSGRYRTSEL